jgi:hypothetical protein
MKRLVMISCLALGTVFGASAASAAAATSSVGGLSTPHSGIVLVKDHRRGPNARHNWRHNRNWRHRGWRGGDRYRGWHRYHSRPWNWRTRGCVVLGPVWVCP